MPRALYLCLAIVAAFQIHLAAATPVDELPITPRVAELAERLGLDPSRDRARFMTEIARLLYATSDTKPAELVNPRLERAPSGPSLIKVPVPLSAAVWSTAVFRRTVPPEQLIATILADRRATLLSRGLAGIDDETLTFLSERPALVRFLYERAPGTFAVFGGTLQVRGGRVVAPGGPDAVPLWEAVVEQPLASPDLFIRALFGDYDGRLAYLYNAIAASPPAAVNFALGFWIPDRNQRTQRFLALSYACIDAYREWRSEDHPFARPLGDLALLLFRIKVDSTGAPLAPNRRSFWARAFDVDQNTSSSTDTPLVGGPDGPIDAAWLVSAMGHLDMYSRTDRLDQFAFGQRVFSDASDTPGTQAADALRSYREHRMLMLTMERMGIRSPAPYLATLGRAADVVSGDLQHRFWSLAQFQGAIALLARMHRSGTLNTSSATPLLVALDAVPFQDSQYDGGVASWIRSELSKVLPREGTWESRIISAMAGPADATRMPKLFWEGQAYRVDLAYGERQRMQIVRDKQGGHTVDLAMAIDELGRTLRSPALTLEETQVTARKARAIAVDSTTRLKHPAVNLMPPSVELPRDALEWLNEAADEASKITRSGDLRRAARIGISLQQLVDIILGNALVSLAYAGDIGDPDGAALLAGNVSLRHDFGLGRKDAGGRLRIPWMLPRQDFQPGVPWHVTGSLLGLDIALAPLNLRRVTMDRLLDAPKLSSIEREAFAVSVLLMDSTRLKDADLERIGGAIDRGRQRVKALAAGAEAFDSIAASLGFDGWRRRVVTWMIQNQPQAIESEFSLVDFLTLGDEAAAGDLNAWGTSAIYTDGCACTKMPNPSAWQVFEGRPQLPMMATTMGDFNLAVALMMREMRLPAVLARPILAVAMQDFLDNMDPATGNDWWGLSRQARITRRQQFEDYVAVAAAVNGPLVPIDSDSDSSRDH